MQRYLKILITTFFLTVLLCVPVFSLEKDPLPSENPPAVSGDNINYDGQARVLPASGGDSQFPVKGRSGRLYSKGTSKGYPMNQGQAGLRQSAAGNVSPRANQNKANFSTSSLSPEKLRDAYTAGYARSPVSPYAGLPGRLRNAEPFLMEKPEWDKKYKTNSFKGSRPVDLSLNPALMNASSGNPNAAASRPWSPKSVVIEKDSPGSSAVDSDVPSVVNAQNVRILLKRVSGNVTVETAAGILVAGGEDAVGVTRVSGKIIIDAKDDKIISENRTLGEKVCQIKPSASSIKIDGKPYRGYLTLYAEGNTLTVVNSLPMEAYLLGVVPAEMPSSWGEEALKAQAVASRSYAVFHLQDGGDDRLWDLEDTEADQVYGGMDSEKPQATLAIYATKGQIILYGGRPAEALFHADSGGYTDSPGDVWKKDYPYLRSVSDRFTTAGGPFKWEYFVTSDKFFNRLRSAGIKADSEDEVKISEKTASGRVMQVAVGDSLVPGNRLRQILDPKEMKSAKYEVKEYGGGFLFSGKGYGHGVGLSQNGAKQMAEMGYSYQSILKFYYKGVRIGRMNSVLYAGRENPYRKKEIYQ